MAARALIGLSFAGFIALGMPEGALGVAWPSLADRDRLLQTNPHVQQAMGNDEQPRMPLPLGDQRLTRLDIPHLDQGAQILVLLFMEEAEHVIAGRRSRCGHGS